MRRNRNPVASEKSVYWRGKVNGLAFALTNRGRGTVDMNYGTGQSLSPLSPVYISGASELLRSIAMNTAVGFPEERRYTESTWQPPALSRHDQAECDYLESLFALDTVEGSDDE